MTENELNLATDRLSSAEEKFVSCMHMFVEASRELTNYLRDHRQHFNDYLHAFDKTEELMAAQNKMLREITAGMEAIVKGVGASNMSLEETNQRVKDLLTRFEDQFGSAAGLEYDN